jgi:hypothetical protein
MCVLELLDGKLHILYMYFLLLRRVRLSVMPMMQDL